MSDNIDIPLTASGSDDINRVISAIDRLHASLEKLGTGTGGLTRLEQQVQQMQASVTTGFAEMAAMAKKGGSDVVAAVQTTSNKILSIEQRRDVELNAMRQRQNVDYVKFWEKQLATVEKGMQADLAARAAAYEKQHELQQRRDMELHTAAAAATQRLVEIQQRRDKEIYDAAASATQRLVEIQQRRDKEIYDAAAAATQRIKEIQQRRDTEEYREAQSQAQRMVELQQRRDMEMHALRTKAAQDATSVAERQRSLNTNFLTAGPTAALGIAQKAAVYANQGGDAAAKYGSAAATADIRALQAAHDRLHPTVQQTTRATEGHNHAMNEAHSLARGLAGSLGGLWLTYGSIIPLLAGAAIAGSLKNIVTVGKEVEYQLNFVAALTKQDVSLDKFLMVTDSSLRSVVESSNAMRMLAQNGLNAQESLGALPAILDLATVGEMQVGQAALAATGATSAFGLQISEVGRVADIFALTAAKSNTSVLAITESMKQASTVSSLFKVSIEETAAMLGLLAKINITGGAAGTSMTNMLTGLYEPTEKGKRALKELGVETMTASGQLKPFTQLLDEMKGSLSRFNDSARVDLLGSIFTVRGVKAAELALQNLDSFKQKAEEARTASGFMRDVVTQLENSTTGAFERMGVTVQNTLVKSFAEAQPYVQRIGLDLTHAFASPEVQNGLGNLATNVARVTGGLIENAGGVGTLITGYLAWRLAASTLVPVIVAAVTATNTATTASLAAAAASVAHTSALAGGAATVATFTLAVETQTAATAASTAASAAWGAVILPALGALAIALAAGAALWLLFRDNTGEADRANMKIRNSIDVVNEGLDREIERLEKANDLWDKKNGRFSKDEGVGASQLEKARAQQKKIEEDIVKGGGTVEGAMRPQFITTPTGIRAKTADYTALSAALIKARENVAALEVAEGEYSTVIKPKNNASEARKALDQAKENAEKFARQVSQVNSKGELFQKDENIRDIYRKGGNVVNELRQLDSLLASGTLSDAQYKDVEARIDQSRVDLKELQDEASKLQGGRALKPKKSELAAERDQNSAEVKRLQGILDLQRQTAAANIEEAASRNRRGDLGDLELINIELKEKLATDQKALDVARAQANVPGTGAAKDQGFANKELAAAKQKEVDVSGAAEKRRTLLAGMAEDERAFDAQTLRDKGQFRDAYLSDFQAKYSLTMARLEKDIEANEGTDFGERLHRYQDFLEKLGEAGAASAAADELGKKFDQVFTDLGMRMQEINLRNGPGTGLASIFTNAMDASDAFEAALPGLERAQQQMQAMANEVGADPARQQTANKMLMDIRSQAAAMRNQWIGVGDTIANSLTKAFGKSGAALGGLLKASVAYGVKRKQIDDDLAAGSKGTAAQKAAAEMQAYNATTAAQITMYGDLTGAAQGFFSEGSKGYIALGAAEKAFRAIEIALAIQNAVTKSGLSTAFTGLFVAGKATETAATVASVAPDVAASMAKGQAAAVAGVAGQAQGDPYTAWARMAAMAVVMAGLGFAVSGAGSGSGGGKSAAEVQKEQGTGGVFGDASTKSNSIKNSLDMLEKNSDNLIPINRGMLDALRNIEASMTGLANLIVRNPDVMSGSNFGVQEGQINLGKPTDGISKQMTTITKTLFPVIGGQIASFINNLWGKTTQKIVDSGIQFGGSVRGLQQGQGFSQYASIDTTKSSWFGLSKSTSNSTQTQGLGGELPAQLGLVFTDLEKGLSAVAVSLGRPAAEVKSVLDGLSIEMSTLSLKDLKGDDLTQALNAVISKAMDQMSEAVFPSLDAFRQVGEGYTETVMRLANNYGVLDAAMESIGTRFGATGMSSLAARERLIGMAGGIDKLSEQTKDFADNFLTEAERLAPVQKYVTEELGRLGYAGLKTREDFKAAVLGLANSGALATEAGAKTYTGLMALEKAFAETTPEIKDLTKSISEIASEAKDLQDELDELTMTRVQLIAKERAALDPSNRALFDQIQAMKLVAEAKSNLNDAYEKEHQEIEDTIERIGGLAKSWKKFRDGLLLSDKSPLTPQQKYQESKRQYDSTVALARNGDKDAQDRYEEVANNFLEASRVSNSSSDVYTADFDQVLSVTDEAIKWAENQVDVAKESLKTLERQVGALIEIKAAVMSVVDAIRALDLANANTPQAKITDLYKTILKREPDAPGMKYWQDAMAGGSSIDDIAAAMKRSNEYTQQAAPVYTAASNQAAAAATAAAPAGPTAAQMEALLAEMAALRRDAAEQTGAGIDAAFASTERAAEQMSDAMAEANAATKWARDNKVDIQ